MITLHFKGGLNSFFKGKFHQQHQTVKVLENFPRGKELLIWTTFSLTSIPFLGFVALGVGIGLPWGVLPVFLHGAVGGALGFCGVCGYLLLGVVAGLRGIFSWVLSERGNFNCWQIFYFGGGDGGSWALAYCFMGFRHFLGIS